MAVIQNDRILMNFVDSISDDRILMMMMTLDVGFSIVSDFAPTFLPLHFALTEEKGSESKSC